MNKKMVLLVYTSILLLSCIGMGFHFIKPVRAATTWTVDDDGPADFSSIQEAINSHLVVDGDTIFVYSGTYFEHVVVNKTVSLIGENRETTIVDASGAGKVFLITADNVNLTGFTIQNSGQLNLGGIDNDCGIGIDHSNGNNISHNIIINNLFGIFLYYSSNNIIAYNNVSFNRHNGISLHSYCDNNLIIGNVASSNSHCGITLFFHSRNNTIIHNIASENDYGINTHQYCEDNDYIGNTVSNNKENGIRFRLSSKNNMIYHNNFVNNNIQAYIAEGSTNTWDNGYPSGGNYWSDYTGVDLFSGHYQNETGSDGIGDAAYVIDASNMDNYPLMEPWSPQNTLTIDSLPTGVTFTADDISYTTPWSEIYDWGTSVSIVMTETYDEYVWSHWLEDGDTNSTKIVIVDRNITLTGVFFHFCDLNNDGIIDIRDISLAAMMFGSYPGHPRWDPIADVNHDDIVDIRDISLIARNFGKTYP